MACESIIAVPWDSCGDFGVDFSSQNTPSERWDIPRAVVYRSRQGAEVQQLPPIVTRRSRL
jgi:hypothetical protein